MAEEEGARLRGRRRPSSAGGSQKWSQKTRASDVALQSPTAFHCIPLFHFSIWGLPHTVHACPRCAALTPGSAGAAGSRHGGFTERRPIYR